MKLKDLWTLYKMSKRWEIVENKLSIPSDELSNLDIRDDGLVLKDEYNPRSNARGVFMPDMTEDDYLKWQQQQSGWSKFYDKVKKVTHAD